MMTSVCLSFDQRWAEKSWTEVLCSVHDKVSALVLNVENPDVQRYVDDCRSMGVPVILDGLGSYRWGEDLRKDQSVRAVEMSTSVTHIRNPWDQTRPRMDIVDLRRPVDETLRRMMRGNRDVHFDGVADNVDACGVIVETDDIPRLTRIKQLNQHADFVFIEYKTSEPTLENLERTNEVFNGKTKPIHCVNTVDDVEKVQTLLTFLKLRDCSMDDQKGMATYVAAFMKMEGIECSAVITDTEHVSFGALVAGQLDVGLVTEGAETQDQVKDKIVALTFSDEDVERWTEEVGVPIVITVVPGSDPRVTYSKGPRRPLGLSRAAKPRTLVQQMDDQSMDGQSEAQSQSQPGAKPSRVILNRTS